MTWTHVAFAEEPRPDLNRTVDPAQPTRRFITVSSLSAAERVDVNRHRLDGDGIEPPFPCGHDAGTAVGDGLDEARLVGTVEPDLVGQVRRTEFRIALGVVTMTGDAVLREDLGSRGRVISRPSWQTRQ